MLSNELQNTLITEYSSLSFVLYNNVLVRIGVSDHFSRFEFEAFSGKKFQYNYASNPVSHYIDHKELSRNERAYSYALAFFRRINLPLEITLSSSVSYKMYPIVELYNFNLFERLFEKYYPDFQKIDIDNNKKKDSFKDSVLQLIFKLWLSGYSLAQCSTNNIINDDLLSNLFNWKQETSVRGRRRYSRVVRFLSFMLSKETFSPIENTIRIRNSTSLIDRELGKWEPLIKTFKTEITDELFNFTFTNLVSRINKHDLLEYIDDSGIEQRESLRSISSGTWVAYSGALRQLADFLNSGGFDTINRCLDFGILQIMVQAVSKLPINAKTDIRIVCRQWLNWYTKVHRINLNINKIVPLSLRNNETSYGKMLNYGAVQILIETLLDDECTYFDDNNISDFRARRACLLQLSTGQRASEICKLFKNCIIPDNHGVLWIHFHDTKGSNSNTVRATPDIIKWVDELKQVAPSEKIMISSKEYPFGDDLEEYRLLANQFNDGPLTYDSMNKFLTRTQKNIWASTPPSGRYFSSHDLRRIRALYMRLTGRSLDEIQDQLGHDSVESQIPYLATKPIEHQVYFKNIQLKGVYANITTEESDDTIEMNKVIDKSHELSCNKYDCAELTKSLLKLSEDISDFDLPKGRVTSPLPTGFPFRLHSCNASGITNCGHTELHCFKCDLYKPDRDTLDDHKVEVFRYMVLLSYEVKLAKKTKDLLESEVIKMRSNDISNLINETFKQLFIKFNLSIDEVDTIKVFLNLKVKIYSKKYIEENPNPTFLEAKEFVLGGDINGK